MGNKRIIAQLHKGKTCPKTFCGILVENSEEMEYIACVITWKDGTTSVHHTSMKNEDMAWLRWCFDQDFRPESP